MTGWIYNTEGDAANAVAAINKHYGFPLSADAVTQTYTNYIKWGDGWAIMADDSLVAVLGDAVELPELNDTEGEWSYL